MENQSTLDINIRNVDVRLNDPVVGSNINGACDNSIDNETQVTSFSEKIDNKSSANLPELADDLREKLHICKDSSNCGLLNGCHKTLHEDMKFVDIAVNGINKCNKFEVFNSNLEKLNHRTCEPPKHCVEISRTNFESLESNVTTIDENPSCPSLELSSKVHDSALNSIRDVQIEKIEAVPPIGSINLEISNDVNITYHGYHSESQMPDIMRLIQKDLSEPYSIYTYRYFIHNWPKLCFLAQYGEQCVGAIVCKLDVHKKHSRRGYIAMLAVDKKYRKKKIGSNLVLKAIHAMVEDNADEVVLETEITNRPALKLYENLGFVRDKRLFRYYLNGVDALRLKLWLR
ncbi:uncharacterized protein [Parasteatoda tepidariorum]|uniref:uncharacterized protein n=1 Tax=Parasteatoda tepidariorum TaxID=114398 RepID=UPI00077F9BA3|nr:uncharacterized protein LOC107442896 [Parasteatoda tepidariorum]